MKRYFGWVLFCTFVVLGAGNVDSSIHRDLLQIKALVTAAVEDVSWWKAQNPQELREILSRYYADPLLAQVCEGAWSFISLPTDWYNHTYVTQIHVKEKRKGKAVVEATLANEDLNTGTVKEGKGYFHLRKTTSGWKIIKADFSWEGEGDL